MCEQTATLHEQLATRKRFVPSATATANATATATGIAIVGVAIIL